MATDAAGVDRTRPLYQLMNTDKRRVAYFYDSDIGNYAYVTGHPMKPHRIRLAHSLVMNYGVYKFLEVYRAKPAVFMEMTQFHTDEYIDFLQKVTPDNMDSYQREQSKYNVGDDCPVFDGLFEFCGISAGGSMEGAARLNRNKCDIAINWAGGLHHAKKSEASGFCYVNDIVLAIIELLRFKKRVLYIDIDVHHGDGVEEAFYTTDRVMTASFHKYGEYFPGTGELRDIGIGPGKNYAVNFPLRDGIDDNTYKTIFRPVVSAIMEYFQPEAVVLQCGGDSLSGDRLGCFNLSMRGHAACVEFVRSFHLPMLVVGGGGYTMRNVSRTWAFETGKLVGVEMDSVLPYNEYYEYYGPDYELDVRSSNMENANSPEYLEKIKIAVIENLKKTAPVPSVQMQDVPRQGLGMTDEEEAELDDLDEDENKDVRMTQRQWEKTRARQDEFEESDDEGMARANGVNYDGPPKRSILDYRNPHADYDMDSGAATPNKKEGSEVPAATETAAEAPETKEVAMEDADAAPAAPEAEKKTEPAAADAEGTATPAPAPAEAAPEKGTADKAADDGDIEMTDVAAEAPAPADAPAAVESAAKEATPAATSEAAKTAASAPEKSADSEPVAKSSAKPDTDAAKAEAPASDEKTEDKTKEKEAVAEDATPKTAEKEKEKEKPAEESSSKAEEAAKGEAEKEKAPEEKPTEKETTEKEAAKKETTEKETTEKKAAEKETAEKEKASEEKAPEAGEEKPVKKEDA